MTDLNRMVREYHQKNGRWPERILLSPERYRDFVHELHEHPLQTSTSNTTRQDGAITVIAMPLPDGIGIQLEP